MVNKLGNLLVRANYLAAAAFGMLLAIVVAAFTMKDAFGRSTWDWRTINLTVLFTLAFYLVPGIRAFLRLSSDGTILPPQLVHERPVVASVVTLAGVIGHFFFVLSMSAAIQIALTEQWPEDAGGPILFFNGLALLSYLIALHCGEWALVGDGISDAERIARSGPGS